MSPTSRVQQTLIASLTKLENSTYLTDEELEWLRASIMRLVAECALLKESNQENETERSDTYAA
jgi:hypothetical protein